MKPPMILLAAAILTGCAASTPQQVREMGPDRQYTFETGNNYQTAYRRILEAARNCYQGQIITATMVVNGDLYPDTQSGTVTVGMYGIASSVYQVIDVQGTDSSHSRVTATFPLGAVDKQGAKVKAWAEGTGTGC